MFDQIEAKWSTILETMRDEKELTDVSYRTWLLPLRPISLEKEGDRQVLTVLFPGDQASVSFIEKRYSFFLQYFIEELTGIRCTISMITSASQARTRSSRTPSPSDASYLSSSLNYKYTFDSFVVGNSNKMAHAAALAVAEAPGEIYNPLFIYGGVGLGKTHLMQAIANFILKEDPKTRIVYVTCEKFMNEMIDSIRNNSTAEFREKYRSVDVLLIDDIQFISKKEGTQLEIFHTFNALYEAKKQIIISSDRPPKEIDNLEDRLRSRFEWGLTVDINLPDYETRMAILRKKEEIEGYTIDNEVIKYIAANVKSNIRELEGALTKVLFNARLNNRPITLESAEEALKDSISQDSSAEINLPHILQVVSEHFGIRQSDITSDRRDKNIVIPRQITMYLCREMAGMPLVSIGKFLGDRDHSTIIHGCRQIEKLLSTDDAMKNTIEVLKKKLSK